MGYVYKSESAEFQRPGWLVVEMLRSNYAALVSCAIFRFQSLKVLL